MSEQNNANTGDTGEQNNSQTQTNNANTGDTGGHMVPKRRLDEVVQQRKEAEAALKEVADGLIEEVPEDMRDLVPDLPAAQKIKWLRTAIKKGVFGGNQDASGPDSKRAGGKPPQNYEGMSPHQMMSGGYEK